MFVRVDVRMHVIVVVVMAMPVAVVMPVVMAVAMVVPFDFRLALGATADSTHYSTSSSLIFSSSPPETCNW